MNIVEKQVEFGRKLFEINQNTFQQVMKSNQENLQKYFELNSEFGQKLPEVRDVTTFVEMQREYGETLWGGIRDAAQTQADIYRSAMEETGEAFRTSVTPADA